MNEVDIYKSNYKSQNAVTIESKTIKVQFLPRFGSNMCSLFYKLKNIELLVQRKGKYKIGSYGSSYVKAECAGVDDMFPTIDECFYENHPWKGIHIPDHGEVWAIPWDIMIENEKIHFFTYGVRFPYKVDKLVYFESDYVLRIDYKVTNLSSFDLDFMWVAHCMLISETGLCINLPEEVKTVVCTWDIDGLIEYGKELNWPVYHNSLGKENNLGLMGMKESGRAIKYFVKDAMSNGWCKLEYPKSELTVTFTFSVKSVPYLGILLNEGKWSNLYNIFIEPATAPFDRLDVSKIHSKCSNVKANSTYEWYLKVSIES